MVPADDDPGVLSGRVRWGTGSGAGIARPEWPVAAPVSRLGAVRVRTIELRILGVTVAVLWLAAFGLVLLGYRPGGPVDILVGLAVIGPVLVAGAAILWPPVARGDRAFAGIAWLALASILLLVPSLAGLVTQLTGRGPQTLLPSLEVAYPWLLALIATGLFAGLGVARRRLGGASLRRARLVLGSVIAAVMVLLAGGAFATAAIVNELALDERPAIASRFGPTDPELEPPTCTDPVGAGPTARLRAAHGRLDRRPLHGPGGARRASATGPTSRGRASPPPGSPWASRAWSGSANACGSLSPGRPWTAAEAERGAGHDIDRQVVAVALARPRPTPRRIAGWPSSTARAPGTAGSPSTA